MKNKRLKFILFTIVFILLIPLIAMQFTNQVNWNLLDFAVAGVLLTSGGFIIEVVLRKVNKDKYRVILIAAILIILLLFWAELAVGIFGNF